MSTQINHTAEQLIREAAKRYTIDAGGNPEIVIAQTIRELYPSESGDYVRSAVLVNSMSALIKKIEREAVMREAEFQRIGQMPLLGIEEYTLPASFMGRPFLDGHAWCQARLAMSQEDTAELERALKAQKRREERDRIRAENDQRLYLVLQDHGIDVSGVTYEQALKIAQTLQPGNDTVPGPASRRTVRTVRTAD